MIITCEKCTKRYLIKEQAVGPQGRKVRCVSCGHVWDQNPIDHTDSAIEADSTPPPRNPEPIAPKETERSWGWISFVFVAAFFMSAVILGRDTITKIWPAAQPFYQAVGFNVSAYTKNVEFDHLEPVHKKEGDQTFVYIQGEIVNTSNEVVLLPPIQIGCLGNCQNLNTEEGKVVVKGTIKNVNKICFKAK